MEAKVFSAINKFEMLKDCNCVLIGISGGADSMSLLHFFSKLRGKSNIEVIAVHINHCLRGDESIRDENFVVNYCVDNRIRLHVYRKDIKKESNELKIGLEECGRKVRYEIFSDLCSRYNAKIATAHTLSDSIETVFMNMLRGTSIKGMCGIPPIRGDIIRPLCFVTRDEVEKYCLNNNIKYIIDSSNLSREYTRNKIRLDIIPQFKKLSSNFENSMLKMMTQLRDDNEFLDTISENKLKEVRVHDSYSVSLISQLPNVIMSRVVFKIACSETKFVPEKRHVEMMMDIIKSGRGKVDVPGAFLSIVEHGIFYFIPRNKKKKNWEYKLTVPKILTESRKKFIIKVMSIEDYNSLVNFDKTLFYNCLDYDMVGDNSIIRNRREGDKFTSAKKKLNKSLKKLFNENKIPISIRDEIAVIANDSGILWVEGFGPSCNCMVNKDTKNVLFIMVEVNEDA